MPADPAITTMADVQRAFTSATMPRREDLTGSWVRIRSVTTERYVNGRDGPDRVSFDPAGIRRADVPGNPLDWTLVFESDTTGGLRAVSHTAWEPRGDRSPVTFAADGEMSFEKDFGADSGPFVFRCRAPIATHLLCVQRGHEAGYAIEFAKMAPASGSPPPDATVR